MTLTGLVAFALAFIVVGMVKAGRARVRSHGVHRLVWHWLSGLPWHGQEVTDAGWSRPGTKAFTRNGHARRWHYRPRRVRAAWRTGVTAVVSSALWGLLYAPAVTVPAIEGAAAAVVLGAVLGAVYWWRGWSHRRQWVRPTHLVAAPLVGLPVATDPAEWLVIPRDRSRVVLLLPPAWKGEAAERTRLVDVVSARLALDAPEVRWSLAGAKPRVELTQSVPPPSRVTLADAMPAIEAAKDDELVWGMGRKSAVVKSSLSGDSPHVGLSMGSGAGKSVTARSLLAQQLHRGAIGLVLDVKMISHQWAANLPNVVIYRRPAEIHAALLWLGEEVERRNEVALAGADEDGNVNADVGPRIIVIAEELNATMDRLRAFWRDTREKDDPKRSPAIGALDAASFTGRQVKANIMYIGQRLSDKATGGGGDARENIGVIAFGRWRVSTWKMLAPDHPMPPKNLTPGRIQVASDRVQEAQGVFMTPAEARAWSVSGVVSPLPSAMPGSGLSRTPETVETGSAVALRTGPGLGMKQEPPPAVPPVSAVTLREAVGAGLFGGLSLAGVRTARHRDPTFPEPVGRDGKAELYELAALVEWAGAEIRSSTSDFGSEIRRASADLQLPLLWLLGQAEFRGEAVGQPPLKLADNRVIGGELDRALDRLGRQLGRREQRALGQVYQGLVGHAGVLANCAHDTAGLRVPFTLRPAFLPGLAGHAGLRRPPRRVSGRCGAHSGASSWWHASPPPRRSPAGCARCAIPGTRPPARPCRRRCSRCQARRGPGTFPPPCGTSHRTLRSAERPAPSLKRPVTSGTLGA